MGPSIQVVLARSLPIILLLCTGCATEERDTTVTRDPIIVAMADRGFDSPLAALEALTTASSAAMRFTDMPSLGFSRSPYWITTELTNTSPQARRRWLVVGHPYLDRVALHVVSENGTILHSAISGDRVPREERPWLATELVYPVVIPGNSSVHLLFQVESSGVLEFPVRVLDREALQERMQMDLLLSGIFFGTIAAIGLYNLLLYLALRDSSYLFYVLYLTGLLVFLMDRNGFTGMIFGDGLLGTSDSARAAAAFAAEGFALLFCMTFMQLSTSRPGLARAMRNTGVFLIVFAAASFFLDVHLALLLCTLAVLIVVAFNLPVALIRIADGFRPALYFILAFLPLGLLVPTFVLKNFNIIGSNWAIDHAFEIGSALEAWLLSFALAHRLTTSKAENERVHLEANQQLEQRVRERTEELNRALNARSEFLAVMSHEIRTPLNGILGTVDMLRDSPLSPDQEHKVHVIEQSGNTLLHLINDILDYTRIEAGKLPIQSEHFNLQALVRDSVSLFEQRARLDGNTLDVHLDDNVGALCEGDSIRLRQVLVNLVSNAVKFTDNGLVQVRVAREKANDDYVLFEVIDTGIGIQDSQKNELFQLFHQADNSLRRRYGGTGLGLAICRQLVELMGGQIDVRDNPSGRGTCFWFRLPLPKAKGLTVTDRPVALPETARSKRLLIVDDNHVNLLVASGLARKLGHVVEVAESGPEAISVLLNDSQPFDLILMDCEMPDMDGMETAREIIRLQRAGRIVDAPIVALTAHAVPDKIRQCHEAGMVSHIAKPINTAKLSQEIRTVLHDGLSSANGSAPRPDAPDRQ